MDTPCRTRRQFFDVDDETHDLGRSRCLYCCRCSRRIALWTQTRRSISSCHPNAQQHRFSIKHSSFSDGGSTEKKTALRIWQQHLSRQQSASCDSPGSCRVDVQDARQGPLNSTGHRTLENSSGRSIPVP